MPERNLKYRLRSADQLFFLHIPKAAGTTFYAILGQYFPEEKVLPATDGRVPFFEEAGVQGLRKFRLLRAHYDHSVYRYLPRKPVFVTMLRDPIERLISHYHFIQRESSNQFHNEVIGERMTLADFVVHPEIQRQVVNRQVRQLAGGLMGEARDLSEDDLLAIAKVRLHEFAFFGLAGRFEDSLRLLCYTFGWDDVREYTLFNVAPDPSDKDELSLLELEAAQEANRLDLALFHYAEEVFQARMEQMVHEKSVEQARAPHEIELPAAPRVYDETSTKPEGYRVRFLAALGRLRRALIPEDSDLEKWYLRVRKRFFDW